MAVTDPEPGGQSARGPPTTLRLVLESAVTPLVTFWGCGGQGGGGDAVAELTVAVAPTGVEGAGGVDGVAVGATAGDARPGVGQGAPKNHPL